MDVSSSRSSKLETNVPDNYNRESECSKYSSTKESKTVREKTRRPMLYGARELDDQCDAVRTIQ